MVSPTILRAFVGDAQHVRCFLIVRLIDTKPDEVARRRIAKKSFVTTADPAPDASFFKAFGALYGLFITVVSPELLEVHNTG